MNKVISISLNGNAYQLEEAGYESLKQYLLQAESQLKDNPDKSEIMSDLEQAIADKCSRYLRPHKNVVTSDEVTQIIKDMGPVDSGSADSAADQADKPAGHDTSSNPDAPKRLYQIDDGAIISGVCNGIAVYFNIDVSIIRIAFVLLTLFTGGIWILAYALMMFLIPHAYTKEDMAAARGAPFNAQEVIQQAKKNYSEFKDKKEWRRHWREQRRMWRDQWHHNIHRWGCNANNNMNQGMHPGSYGARIIAGLLLPIASIVGVFIFWAWMLAIISVATTGTIFGWHAPLGNTPQWVLIIIMLMLCGITTAPLKGIRRALKYNLAYPGLVWAGVWESFVWLGLSIVIVWYAYHHFPQVQYFLEHAGEIFRNIWENMSKDIHGAPASPSPTAMLSQGPVGITGLLVQQASQLQFRSVLGG